MSIKEKNDITDRHGYFYSNLYYMYFLLKVKIITVIGILYWLRFIKNAIKWKNGHEFKAQFTSADMRVYKQ